MTLLWTLLTTFFVDDGPIVPAPDRSGAIIWDGELDKVSVGENLNLPRLTPPTWHRSPSWMVASPPVKPTPFDVFSPAARPPQEFPGLFPCAPVALVPCPAPTPREEPPAVRHVSFLGGGAELTLAANDASETQECPATGNGPKAPSVVQSEWKRIHPHGHGPHDPAGPMFIAPFFPPHPLIPFDVHQTAFADPADTIPHPHRGGPFPGAKKVQHVVSATYDVPHASAASLQTILEQGEGVLSCEVKGDELTVTAYPPYQAAIAQFLQAMDLKGQKPQMISKPIEAIGTKPAASKCCNRECQCKKCECNCQCCGTKDDVTAVDPGEFSLAKSLAYHYYGLVKPQQIDACSGTKPCAAACPSEAYCPTPCHSEQTVKSNATPSKTIQVEILATPEGVMLRTSDGTCIRADRIQLQTHDISKLEVEQRKSAPVSFTPYASPAPIERAAKPLPTY